MIFINVYIINKMFDLFLEYLDVNDGFKSLIERNIFVIDNPKLFMKIFSSIEEPIDEDVHNYIGLFYMYVYKDYRRALNYLTMDSFKVICYIELSRYDEAQTCYENGIVNKDCIITYAIDNNLDFMTNVYVNNYQSIDEPDVYKLINTTNSPEKLYEIAKYYYNLYIPNSKRFMDFLDDENEEEMTDEYNTIWLYSVNMELCLRECIKKNYEKAAIFMAKYERQYEHDEQSFLEFINIPINNEVAMLHLIDYYYEINDCVNGNLLMSKLITTNSHMYIKPKYFNKINNNILVQYIMIQCCNSEELPYNINIEITNYTHELEQLESIIVLRKKIIYYENINNHKTCQRCKRENILNIPLECSHQVCCGCYSLNKCYDETCLHTNTQYKAVFSCPQTNTSST